MMLHSADAVKQGFSKIVICTVDTDVVVLSVATVAKFPQVDLLVAFGVCGIFHYLPSQKISQGIGEEMSKALSFFHALTRV